MKKFLNLSTIQKSLTKQTNAFMNFLKHRQKKHLTVLQSAIVIKFLPTENSMTHQTE